MSADKYPSIFSRQMATIVYVYHSIDQLESVCITSIYPTCHMYFLGIHTCTMRSTPEPWPGTLCCILRQDTLLSQCLSPPRCTNGYQRIVGENLTICGGVTCDGLASRPGEVEILPAASCYRNRDKLRLQWALWPLRLRFFYTLALTPWHSDTLT